ncbi:2-dehydropantoate 2-reductase [Planctomycetaceae bacterium SCGC AG-212-F19]|nr:2-dehydropantoate 2-reductase [Planctomycetaceae bacterium SCGC AG-212-F19]
MKFAVVGAGSVGGYLGARLALAGEEVTFVARGANLAAIAGHGFKLIEEDGTEKVATNVRAAGLHEAGPYDVVLLAVKAHQIPALAPQLRGLFGPDTVVVTLQNGIPWWFFYKWGGEYEGRPIRSVDPEDSIATHIENERVVGTVVYFASQVIAPGVVKVIEGNRLALGEPNLSVSERCQQLSATFVRAGFKAPVVNDLRGEIWLKLWGNMVFNPLSALTHATLVDICQFPLTRTLAATMMAEAQRVAEKLGITIRLGIERRIAGAEAVGKHKTSTLQDVEAGRALELDALIGSVVELARLTRTPTPATDAVYACASLLAKRLADEKGRLQIHPVS